MNIKIYNVWKLCIIFCITTHKGAKSTFPTGLEIVKIAYSSAPKPNSFLNIEKKIKEIGSNIRQLAATEDYVEISVLNGPELDTLVAFLTREKIRYKFLTADVSKRIQAESDVLQQRSVFKSLTNPSLFTLDQYHTHLELNTFLKALSNAYPAISQIFSVGYSFQGRQMLGIRIGLNPKNPDVWIDAGATARNWIGPASAVFIASQLTQKYSSDNSVAALVQKYNFYILPVSNPDGYDYTWTTDRMWIKTRSDTTCNLWQCCLGANFNRNWNYQWGSSGGSSQNPCNDAYSGTKAFSEPESLAISNMIGSLRLIAYLTYDGFGELLQYPYTYAKNMFPADYRNLISIGTKAVQSITAVHDTAFRLENGADNNFYRAAGFPTDFVKGVLNVSLTFTIQSRPSGGSLGYILSQDQIIPSAEETFQGIKSILA